MEFAPSGTLVAGVNYGNPVIAQRPAAGGEPQGVGPALARELARRLGLPIRYAIYDTAGTMAEAAKAGEWDVAFLAADPERAADIAFSAPYVLIEGTYVVRADSALRRIEDFDRPGVRISAIAKSAYDLWLTRNLKQARIVRFPAFEETLEALRAGEVDAAGGIRQPLVAVAAREPGLRVVEGAFMSIRQASGVPKARAEAARYLQAFIEEVKASGFVARALEESGQGGVAVAPPAPAA